METRLSFFLFFIFVEVVFNAFVIWGAYQAFAGITGKLTNAVREIETSGTTRTWIESLRVASEQAVAITGITKQKIEEFNPRFDDIQIRYEFFLAQVDTRIERITQDISDNATRVRDAVAEPAEKFAATAAGIQNVLSFVAPTAYSDEGDE